MRASRKHWPWPQFLLCAAAAALAAILYLTTPQKPPKLSSAEWTMLRAHTVSDLGADLRQCELVRPAVAGAALGS